MKKLFVLAALLLGISICADASINREDPPKRNQWSSDNCKDAGVTTTTNNRYDENGYTSHVRVNAPSSNKDGYQTRTTVRDKVDGYVVDEITTSTNKSQSGASFGKRSYKQEVTSSTECKWNN